MTGTFSLSKFQSDEGPIKTLQYHNISLSVLSEKHV